VPGVVTGVATAVMGLGGCDCLDWCESELIGSSRGDVDTRGTQLVWPGLGGGSRASEPSGFVSLEDSDVSLTLRPGVSSNSAWGTLSMLAILIMCFAFGSVTCTSPNSALLLALHHA
jgi:hypothetical protein